MRVERQDGQVLVAVTGDLDLATASALRDAVSELIVAGGEPSAAAPVPAPVPDPASEPAAPDLVLDLAEVGFLDSSGLGALLQVRAEVLAAGGRLRLAQVAPGPRRVISIAGLAGTFGLDG